MPVKIGGHLIGQGYPPFVIAEMSGNHNQSLEKALLIVDAAAKSGAQAIKLQTYTADTITLDVRGGEFEITDISNLWAGKNLHELYSSAHTPWDWHAPIIERARQHGLTCFSSPFDESAVDFLEDLGMPAYKIASFENNHLPLISKAASTGKPLIISSGMASLSELEKAVMTAREAGCEDLILLKCTSTYPASPKDSNLACIPYMRELFKCEVGLSDHTMGSGVATASVAFGAVVIEKHFTISREDGGVDSAFSMEPKELHNLITDCKNAWEAIGQVKFGPTKGEMNSLQFKRSVYVSSDIKEGEEFTRDNIRIVRPGYGAPPEYFEFIIGKKARRAYSTGEALSLENLFA